MKAGCTLLNGELRSEHSNGFDMPPFCERAACQPGKLVKIGVEFPFEDEQTSGCSGERFWMQIISQDAKTKRYKGTVTNDLFWGECHDLKCGDVIEFGPEHILQVDVPPPGAKLPLLGRNRPLIINEALRRDVAEVLKYAKEHRYNLRDILHLMAHPEYAPGKNPQFVVEFPFGYRCVYTEEQQEAGWMRHISVSVMAKGVLPGVVPVQQLMLEFGFTRPLEQCVIEVMQENVDSVNVWELITP